jgi:CBS domain-containing protein
MRIRELMTTNVKSCNEDTDLAAAAKIMWDCDCGIVPVLNGERNVVGVITDRDICIAAATRSVIPADLRVRDVMSREVAVCAELDDVQSALSALKKRRVRRLPVVDDEGRLVGIVSLNDLAGRAECRRGAELPGEEFLETMKVIGAHPKVTAAVA